MKTIDMHCDTIMKLCIDSKNNIQSNLKNNEYHIDLEKMKKGEYLAQCFAMFVPFTVENPFETCMDMIVRYYKEIEANSDYILPALNYQDIIEKFKECIKKYDVEDKVDLQASFCLGHCSDGVTVKADEEFLLNVNKDNAEEIFVNEVLPEING